MGARDRDLGGGVFRTAAATEKYSRLDLYAMGLATEAEVPRWFYVDAPISSQERDSGPEVGSFINGTRRDVLIQDVIDALGPRMPAAADSPRLHRQAYIFGGASASRSEDLTGWPHQRAVWSLLAATTRTDDGAHNAHA